MNTNTMLYFATYLIMYSIMGWILESVYKSIYEKKFVNSGFLMGPYCPIYGFGAIIMLLTLSFLKEKPILLFMAAFLILSCWEYMVGLFLEKVFKTKYWDYSNLKFNLQGRVCLKNSIYWGILGVLFICVLHPIVERAVLGIPTDILLQTCVMIGIAFTVDLIVSVTSTLNIEVMIEKINELGDTIKEKAKELSEISSKSKEKVLNIEKDTLEKLIKTLKLKQTRLKIRMYKQANRMKKAFPTMKSETITNFLNQKIDLEKLKETIRKKE